MWVIRSPTALDRPSIQVGDLRCELKGLERERGCYHESTQKLGTSLSVRQLRNCWRRLTKSRPRVHLTLEIERVGDCVRNGAGVVV